ncbi:cation transporter [Actinomycetota bacterium]
MSKEVSFGATSLPAEQRQALGKAKRLEWITIAYMATCVAVVFSVMGSSQAMKAAWIEDMLGFVPSIAFLAAVREAGKPPSPEHPYGRHRAVASGHLAAAVALLIMGVFLIVDSGMGLVKGEHPPIGTMHLFGHTVWAGWVMIAAMFYTGIGPVILGRLKMPLAEKLHDRVLFADADMQKADWMTAGGTVAGIIGIGLGLWWADAAVAIAIALSIVRDGWSNVKFAARSLMDGRARTYDSEHTHPLVAQVHETLVHQPWVADARVRVRDQGHLFHVDAFVQPRDGVVPAHRVEEAAQSVRDLDWKVADVSITPLPQLPDTHDVPDARADQQ